MKIVLQNEAQKALLEHELSSQLYDGHWENYSTQAEWKYFIDAEMVVDPDALSIRYEGYHGRPFNFLSEDFYFVFGERMKVLYAMSMINPRSVKFTSEDYSRKLMPQFYAYEGIKTLEEFDPIETEYDFRVVTTFEFRTQLLEILPTITDNMVKKELNALTTSIYLNKQKNIC